MATTTATEVELELEPVSRATGVSYRESQNARDRSVDNVLQASREADSTVPDGGYGWVVTLSCATLAWSFIGTTYCWGVFQDALVKEGVATPATLAFVGSMPSTVMAVLATISGRATKLLGARYSAMLGISLMALGQITSGFTVHEVKGLFVTAGLVVGIGMRYV